MQCFIYKSQKIDQMYIYLERRDDFSRVPEILLENFGQMVFVMQLHLHPQRKLARENVNIVMDGLSNKGFFVQLPPAVIPLPLAITNDRLH